MDFLQQFTNKMKQREVIRFNDLLENETTFPFLNTNI
jgi:hypothetical protein